MSKFVDSIYKIHNNLFLLTPLIVEFYKNLEVKQKNILLVYFVLPLVLYEESKLSLKNSNINSSIHTFTNNNDKKKRGNLYGLSHRVEIYKDVTNKCIQHAIDNKWIKLNDDLSVEVLNKNIKCSENLKDSFKASSNLYKIFKDLEVLTIYRLLGVKKL